MNVVTEIVVGTEVDLRADLAAAIALAAEAKSAAAAAEDAVARGRELLEGAEQKHEAAKAALAGARESDARSLADGVKRRGGATGGGATRRARDAIADAEDAEAVSRDAVDQLLGAAAEADAQFQWALNAVLTARNAVLADLAAKVIERGRKARLEAAVAERLLGEMLHADDRLPEFDDVLDRIDAGKQRDEPLQAVKRDAEYFIGAIAGDGERARVDQAAAAVRDFVTKLEIDANAEVPDIGVAI
jgi:hypothetical protein